MKEQNEIWSIIEAETELYNKLGLKESTDYEKFYLYSLVTHSTAIEGSTLTDIETQLLFDEGITAKGKPLVHHLMNEDLKNAYLFASLKAKEKTPVSVEFLKELNALVMKSTGGVTNVAGGVFDSSKGDFRLCGVAAGYGGKSYMNCLKVPEKVSELCGELNSRLDKGETSRDCYNLSFDAHLNLVTVHPWIDGNGRTSRLLMNYIQFCHQLIPTKVYREDKSEYIAALIESRERENSLPFRNFMARQLLKTLKEETTNYRRSQNKGTAFMF